MAITDFQHRILRAADPFVFDQNPLQSQTKYESQHLLRSWIERSVTHEVIVKPYSQRAYLVASDLSLLQSSYANAKSLDADVARRPPRQPSEELRKLYQKHWAIEIGGRYYELVQKDGLSEFSCASVTRRDLRRVVMRIFVGRSHMAPQVLEAIGEPILVQFWDGFVIRHALISCQVRLLLQVRLATKSQGIIAIVLCASSQAYAYVLTTAWKRLTFCHSGSKNILQHPNSIRVQDAEAGRIRPAQLKHRI